MAHSRAAQLKCQAEEPQRQLRAVRGGARARRRGWRIALNAALWVAVGVGGVWAWREAGAFLCSDPRFALPASWHDGQPSALEIRGLRYASRHAIEQVFSQDAGRSIYMIPLAERRRQLMAIDWVRDAVVMRRWPRQLIVRVVERQPVAFVVASGQAGGPGETLLIDEEGVVLRPPTRGDFLLPVLRGVTPEQPWPQRRAGVRRMLRLLSEALPYAGQITEVDVGDAENMIVTLAWGNRVARLLLGDENLGERLKLFCEYYPQVVRQSPGAQVFDLRVDGQIRALPSAGQGGGEESDHAR